MSLSSNKPSIQFNVKDFGAVGNGVTDDWAAFDTMLASINSTTGCKVFVPAGKYRLSKPLRIYKNVHLFGATGLGFLGADAVSGSSQLIFDAGINGIICENTHTAPGAVAGGADWSTIEKILVRQPSKTGTCHGFMAFCRIKFVDCAAIGFSGDGYHIVAATDMNTTDFNITWVPSTVYKVGDVRKNGSFYYFCQQGGTSASSGGPTAHVGYANYPITDGTVIWSWVDSTNANLWRIDNCVSDSCGRHGLYVEGADVNGGVCSGFSAQVNGGWGNFR